MDVKTLLIVAEPFTSLAFCSGVALASITFTLATVSLETLAILATLAFVRC